MFATEQKTEIRGHTRWMLRRDTAEVLSIEHNCFEFPWLEKDFIRCLRQRNCIGMVNEYQEQVIGFMIYELHKSRIHLLNFAVHREYQRRGVGNQIIGTLLNLEILKQHFHRNSDFIAFSPHLKRLVLKVRETNLPAQLFFQKCGFRATSVLRGYYKDTPEDAYVMQYRYKKPPNKIEKPENLLARIVSRLTG